MICSIKQLYRTPFKLILFFLLTAMSTALLVMGIHLWSDTTRKLNAMEKVFTTIATVTQKEDSIVTTSQWDAASQSYTNRDSRVYNKILPETVLKFKGADYLKGPEKRPYYGAYMPDYHKMFEDSQGSTLNSYLIVEFSPEEDCIPDHPVGVNIVKVLLGETYGSNQLLYYDRYTENPAPLYAGKTYIACLRLSPNAYTEAQIGTQVEFVPIWKPIYSSQFDKTSKELESKLNLNEYPSCEEVTEGFYQTGRGKYWLNFIETLHQLDETIPVLPTGSLTLLPAFHAREAAIVDGREITEEEFQSGEAVCLITSDFAQSNNLKIGDTIFLPLYFANYGTAPSFLFGYSSGYIYFSLLNAQGEPYSIFWEVKYKIVGTYRYNGAQAVGISDGTEMARDMVIIPSKSVRASDENNIVDYGPMRATTTSFQISNGSIAKFQAALTKAVPESSLLEITYDDNGYEQISGDLKSARDIAVLLGAIGLLSTLAILMLLLYFFVIKQKKRTAIERSLGMSRRQCRVSIISGIMVLTIAATILGSIVSAVLIKEMLTIGGANQTGYNTMYSSWEQEEGNSHLLEKLDADTLDTVWIPNFATPVMLSAFMLISSVFLVNRNLNIEPIILLSTRGN